VVLVSLTGCAGFVDELRAGFSAPSSRSAGQGEYVNYPGYGLVYVDHPSRFTAIDDNAFDAVEADTVASEGGATSSSIAPGESGGTAAAPSSASIPSSGTPAFVSGALTPPSAIQR